MLSRDSTRPGKPGDFEFVSPRFHEPEDHAELGDSSFQTIRAADQFAEQK
jgi:hypothetical protein